MLFRVGAQKPEHDGLIWTLVWLLIKQIAPVCKWIGGRWCSAVSIRPALRQRCWGRFGHGETLGGKFGVRAVHQIFSFRLYLVFWMDEVRIIVHPGTIENKEAIRGIGSSK